MLSRADNELVTRTGRGTPMGELMRRYWVPALLSEELPGPDCPPVQVRLMGEELVAFRDSNGVVGLLDEHCSHRGTSLFYGRNEECGLRCIYHGWKYDVEGRVLDTPAEPTDSTMKKRILHPAYPTHEAAGMVFAYLGPADKQPLFPNYSWATVPNERISVTKSLQDCNYLQGLEGECDSSHLTFLHRTLADVNNPRMKPITEYATEDADFGVRLVARRDIGDGTSYVRVSSFVMPVDCWIPAGDVGSVHFYVPAGDDEHSWRYNLGFRRRPADGSSAAPARPDSERFWDENYNKVRNQSNHYQQDRELQRTVNYTGMGGNYVVHDSCATESMGPIYDRSREHLGSSDKAVMAVRRWLLEQIKGYAEGGEPTNLVYDPERNAFPHVDTFARTVEGADWHTPFPHLKATAAEAGAAPLVASAW
jgi:phthalate 4,5-dioxygenase